MDGGRFDDLTRGLARPRSRRGVLGTLVALLGSAGLTRRADAAGRGNAAAAHFCGQVFRHDPPGVGRCVSDAAHGRGVFYECEGNPANYCNGACTNVASDPTNCGVCGTVCPSDACNFPLCRADGTCGTAPGNDGGACQTDAGTAGTCCGGECCPSACQCVHTLAGGCEEARTFCSATDRPVPYGHCSSDFDCDTGYFCCTDFAHCGTWFPYNPPNACVPIQCSCNEAACPAGMICARNNQAIPVIEADCWPVCAVA